MLPVIEEVFVRRKKLISTDDMLDMVVITQTVPGLIAVNSAVYVGLKTAGFFGALAALFGVMLPSVIIILIIASLFPALDSTNPVVAQAFSCVRAAITGVFIVTALRLAQKTLVSWGEKTAAVLFLTAIVGGVNPAYVILISMPLGVVYVWWVKKKLPSGAGGGHA